MSKRDHIHRWVRSLVMELASENLELTAREFREQLAPVIEEEGFPMPGIDWFRKRMHEVREVLDDQDQPWSLGVLASPRQAHLETDALPDICNIWKMCLIAGMPFTVRQARWVARLRKLVPEYTPGQDNTASLHKLALLYSGREIAHMAEAAKPTNQSRQFTDLDTSDMDAALMIPSDVTHTNQENG